MNRTFPIAQAFSTSPISSQPPRGPKHLAGSSSPDGPPSPLKTVAGRCLKLSKSVSTLASIIHPSTSTTHTGDDDHTHRPPVKMRRTTSDCSTLFSHITSKTDDDFFSITSPIAYKCKVSFTAMAAPAAEPFEKIAVPMQLSPMKIPDEPHHNMILPCVETGKDALKRIAPDTLVKLLNGEFDGTFDEYYIIDCRFPYEFDGGHIVSARNMNTVKEMEDLFFNPPMADKRVVIIYHCEFSSQRAPRMALHLRNHDRNLNFNNYPNLHYPDVYVLKGGYREFFSQFKDRCVPQRYIEMTDAAFRDELKRNMTNHRREFRKCKSVSDVRIPGFGL